MQETQETQVQSLCQEDPLEEEMTTHSSILAWKNSEDSGAWYATVHGVSKSHTWLSDWAPTQHEQTFSNGNLMIINCYIIKIKLHFTNDIMNII